ncbi:MAG: hypothetical protein LKF34_03615 [Acidaminococcaceae bacterium]|jgi:hypothetical protein|nr:hypothetical protein [Acidaminococcaceae bacterium]
MISEIGVFSQTVITTLGLTIAPGTPIYLGQSNIIHMKSKHLEDYLKYEAYITDILSNPDYVAINRKDSSIEYVKLFLTNSEYVKVAVRVSTNGIYYARSLYVLNAKRVQNFITAGTLKPV